GPAPTMATGYSDFRGNAPLSIAMCRHVGSNGPQPQVRKAYAIAGQTFLHRPRLPATKASHSEFLCVNIFSKISRISDSRTCCLMSVQSISLKTSAGHGVSSYEARPDKSPRGGIVLLQEIFGIAGYIRRVCEGYAKHGYHVVAPALFDRVRPGIALTYSEEGVHTGRELRGKIPWEKTFADLEAAKARLKGAGKVATLGYCWGGRLSWRAPSHIGGIAGAVCYYGTQIPPYTSEQPRCPVLMH